MASILLVPSVIARPRVKANRETRPRARRSVVFAASDLRRVGYASIARGGRVDATLPGEPRRERGDDVPRLRIRRGWPEAPSRARDARRAPPWRRWTCSRRPGPSSPSKWARRFPNYLDLGGCDYSGADLSGTVLSGAIASGANFERANLTGGEMSRAKAIGTNRDAKLALAQLLRGESPAGATCEALDFDNAILTNARFGKDGKCSNWANLEGVNWDGALLEFVGRAAGVRESHRGRFRKGNLGVPMRLDGPSSARGRERALRAEVCRARASLGSDWTRGARATRMNTNASVSA